LKTIQYALSVIAANNDNPFTIFLDTGTYSPNTNGETFPLCLFSYVSIKGKGEDKTILNANREKNVLYMRNVQHTKIDGITITNGSAQFGGGIYCDNSSPSLLNVTISGNMAKFGGGGINCSNSSPSLSNVIITGNSAKDAGGINCSNSSPSLSSVTITGNFANDYGGGINCFNSNPSLSNVTISGNTANDSGGGFYCYYSSPSLSNVTISGNTANDSGGGFYSCRNSTIIFDNENRCNIYSNSA
ncbi:hypothetical protein MHK_010436, partial [Candidatus Magnetomorum sp. HK-1]